MMKEPRRCRLCDVWPTLVIIGKRQHPDEFTSWEYRLVCQRCLATDSAPTESEAIKLWNADHGKRGVTPET